MHVGEPEIAAGVTVGQLLVVKAHEVEHRGVEVMDTRRVLYSLEAEIIGGPVHRAATNASAGHPNGEAVMVVVAA